ncbi:MAG TPA: hypothetical protein VF857_07890 [Spirochaetota bacterium]
MMKVSERSHVELKLSASLSNERAVYATKNPLSSHHVMLLAKDDFYR